MSDTLDSTGLTTSSRTEIVAELTSGFQSIYGADINLDSNSPDAQLLQIFAQGAVDLRELLASIYNSFDPDKAVGRALDARCAINGVYRNAGSYTYVTVNVTVDRAIVLPGLDDYPTVGAFTVANVAGTKFSLAASTSVSNGSYPYTRSLTFRAVDLGAIAVGVGDIQFISTPTLGVTAVGNTSAASTVGTNEETDASLRVRRQTALALPARGSYEAILSAASAVENVTQATLYENTTNSTDANGVAAHGIWLIVAGGTDSAVANAVYPRRPLGAPMQGSTTVNVTQVDGSTFPLKFSRPTSETLYFSFTLATTDGTAFDAKGIGTALINTFSYGIGAKADVSALVVALRSIQGNLVISSEGVSLTDGSYAATVSPSSVDKQFHLLTTSVKINGTFVSAM